MSRLDQPSAWPNVPFFNLLFCDCTLGYWCLAPFDSCLFQYRYTREQHTCDLATSPVIVSYCYCFWMITELMSTRAVYVCIMLSHVHTFLVLAPLPLFLVHCIPLFSVVVGYGKSSSFMSLSSRALHYLTVSAFISPVLITCRWTFIKIKGGCLQHLLHQIETQ